MAGAKRVIAIDPVEFKREKAMEMGATHTYSSIEEARPRPAGAHLGRHVPTRRSSPSASSTGDMLEPALDLVGKGGTLVVTVHRQHDGAATPAEPVHALHDEQGRSTAPCSARPTPAPTIPNLLSMYREGMLQARRADHQHLHRSTR